MLSRLLATSVTLVAGIGLVLPGSPAVARRTSLPTHVNDCWSTDRVPPVIDSLTVSPTAIDTDAPTTVRFTVQAHDPGPGTRSGVGKVRVSLVSEHGGAGVTSAPLTHGSDGLWHGTATVPAGRHGTFDATVSASDRSGDGTNSLQTGAPTLRGFVDVVQATTSTPPNDDTTPPSLTGLRLSAARVDTRAKAKTMKVTATATDDDTGVAQVRVHFQPNNGSGAHDAVLQQVGQTDEFRGTARFPTDTGSHHEGLGAFVTDRAGNTFAYGRGGLRRLGLTPRIRVVSGPRDTQGPDLVRVLHAAPSIDLTRRGRWYPVRVLMSDPQGVRSVSTHLRGGTGNVALRRVSGTALRGVWAGRLRVARCSYGPATWPLHVNATDRHRVSHGAHVRTVRIVSPDRIPPRAQGVWTASPTVFRVSEPVHGISVTSVQAYDTDDDPVSGTWKCRAGHGGHSRPVSCRTGSVLRATFYPDASGTSLGSVDWEPGLHLDVLDAHGNPMFASVNPQTVD